MKTKIKLLSIALLGLSASLHAQTSSEKKTCIKINMVVNGKVTKIDTCFTNMTEEQVQQALKSMGVSDVASDLNIGDINIQIDSIDSKDGKKVEKVVISTDGKDGKKQTVKVISGGNGTESSVVVDGDDEDASAYSYTTDDNGKEKVIVKSSPNGASTIIINEDDEKDNDGKASKKVKVMVFKNVEVKNLSDADKKELPEGVANTMASAKPFNSLAVAPNPTEGNLRITYKSSSDEPLQIKVYDTYGKTVLTQNYSGLNSDVDKTISLNNLGKGIYFVQLVQGKQSEVRKVVVR